MFPQGFRVLQKALHSSLSCFSRWELNLLSGTNVTKKKDLTAHFFAPLSYPPKPQALYLYLNFLSATLMTRPEETGTDKSKPVALCIKHCVNLILLSLQCLWCVFITDVIHEDKGYCSHQGVARDAAGGRVLAPHPLALSGIPGMWPGKAGRVCPRTRGLPRSPLTTTRSRPAAIRRWMTGTDPCQPSAPGEARLRKKVKVADCEAIWRMSTCHMATVFKMFTR